MRVLYSQQGFKMIQSILQTTIRNTRTVTSSTTVRTAAQNLRYRCLSTSSILLLFPYTTAATSGTTINPTLHLPSVEQFDHTRYTINKRCRSIFSPNCRTRSLTNIQKMCLTTINGGGGDNTTEKDAIVALPSTMTGPPIASLIEPGHCQFTTEWTSVPLLERWRVSSTTMLLRFGLPDPSKSLQLSTCACILAHTKMDNNNEDVVRPYTPISTNADIGYFDLLVKHYGPTSKMSRYMHDIMKIGDTLDFKHIEFNVKIQAPFGNKPHICMIVGGTGITPMIQALHAILGSSASTTKVTMLYGSKFANDVLGYEILDQWSKDYPDRLTVVHVLSDEPQDSAWTGLRGFINQSLLEQHVPSPNDDPLIFICGPPPMYNALSGPREEKDVTGILGAMGYHTEHVYKF